uniref:U10-hottentoxin-Hj2a n=1 Tax=Hottentotta judaicus TaxID=6863 RepID=KA23I_HOTJU|nr:RecName: Full=U10-hottentoxin-Hj2a; Flags: Precursor [Hottentotta judaicus]ADY39598.1 U10-hottentoxin-Hj2a [Hottentotta judaicus]
MQKLLIILILFCILKFNVDVEGRTAFPCNQSKCQERCKKEIKKGKCILQFISVSASQSCRCY